ncbi:MAG: ribosomal RNA small subunit methyltransferase A [Armatimonadetes bacterium]|nr:ribosomal RNA small subunit methyltransferase A [Armatimonadota bacterium]
MGRRLGQHFLRAPGVVEKILSAAGITRADSVVEIGPGEGALTFPLCREAGRVVAFELDRRLAEALPPLPRLEVRCQDFLESRLDEFRGWKVVANLPYYITSPIVEKLLVEGRSLAGMWLMMQREVAERIVSPGTRQAGSLTYFVQFFTRPKLLFRVKPGSFRPPPEVESAVVELLPRDELPSSDPVRFQRLVRTVFSMRRKTLRRSLSTIHSEPERPLELAGIDPSRRPETMSLEEFLRLEAALREDENGR